LLKTAKCAAMKSLLFMICESDSDAAANGKHAESS